MSYVLIKVSSKLDWAEYHAIRKAELFYDREYDENNKDEFLLENHPMLFKFNGKAVGTVRLDKISDHLILRLLAIKRSEQNKGVGRQLFSNILKFSANVKVKKLLVNADPGAVGFYKKLGFNPDSWNPDDLKDISEDCIQMSFSL